MPLIYLPKECGIEGKVVAGLSWHDVTETPVLRKWRPQRTEKWFAQIDEAGKEKQYGTTAETKLKGQVSAAALVARSRKDSQFFLVLPVKRIDERSDTDYLWLVGIDNGHVLPGTDLIDTKERIIQELQALLSIYGNEFDVFAPGNVEQFVAKDAQEHEFFNKIYLDSKVKLRQFSGYGRVYAVIGLLAMFAATDYAYDMYKKAQEESRRAALAAKQLMEKDVIDVEAVRAKVLEIEQSQYLARLALLDPKTQIEDIVDLYKDLPLSINGWQIISVTFQLNGDAKSGNVQVNAKRDSGFVSGINDSTYFDGWDVKYDDMGNMAMITKTLIFEESSPLLESIDDVVEKEEVAKFAVMDFSQRSDIKFRYDKKRPMPLHPKSRSEASQIQLNTSLLGISVGPVVFSGMAESQMKDAAEFLNKHKYTYQIRNLTIDTKYPHRWKIEAIRHVKN